MTISFQEKENLIKKINFEILKESKTGVDPYQLSEKSRAGYSLVTGLFYEKTLKEISSFYAVSMPEIDYWMDMLEIDIEVKRFKEKKKKNPIDEWIKENIDNEVTAKQISENCGVSLPTVYSYISSNIGWFKKIRRGIYLVIDAEKERLKAKGQI
jgi:hypothetical protein